MTRHRAAHVSVAALAWLALNGCGGGDPQGTPTSTAGTLPEARLPAGTTLTVRCGETDQPVAGASLVVGGRHYSTDAAGELRLAEAVAYGADVDIIADGYLVRETWLRELQEGFTLWPRTSTSGINERFTQELVYTYGAYCCPPEGGSLGQARLERMRTGTHASVGLPESLAGTAAVTAVREALDAVNAASDGRVAFNLSGSPDGDVRILIDPTGTGAYFDASMQGYWITGGDVVLTSSRFAELPGGNRSDALHELLRYTLAHEFGHCLGLQHALTADGLMKPFAQFVLVGSQVRVDEPRFSPMELALLRLAYQRPGGNVYPDTDRGVRGTAARTRRIICVIPHM